MSIGSSRKVCFGKVLTKVTVEVQLKLGSILWLLDVDKPPTTILNVFISLVCLSSSRSESLS